MPWKLASGCPPARATTVGTASMPNIWATRGTTSTFTVANDHVPLSSAARTPSASASCSRGVTAGRPEHHDDRQLTGPDQHLGFEIRLGDLDTTARSGGTAGRGLLGPLFEAGQIDGTGHGWADRGAWTRHAAKSVTSSYGAESSG